MSDKKLKKQTRLLQAGRSPKDNFGIVNPPVYHASTVTWPTIADLEHANKTPYDGVRYGTRGTTTTFALEDAVTELENGYRSIAVCSGLTAVTAPLTAFLSSGDHILMVDSAYGPSRVFCDSNLNRFGIETTYYDPMIGAGIEALVKDNTKLIFLESPGSLTFEVQDVPAIVAVAKSRGITTIIDNTWAAGTYFRPLDHGVDVTVQAVTKYIGGHADLIMGVITTTEEAYLPVKRECSVLGIHAAPDDCFLALRGLRSMNARLALHQEHALKLANWLGGREEVARVLHPALPSCPGHEIWKRDFSGSSGLFSIVLKDSYSKQAVTAMVEGLDLFPIGYSWGGYESLIIPAYPQQSRTATKWKSGPVVRIHAGLEDPDDLIADLEKGLARLNAAS